MKFLHRLNEPYMSGTNIICSKDRVRKTLSTIFTACYKKICLKSLLFNSERFIVFPSHEKHTIINPHGAFISVMLVHTIHFFRCVRIQQTEMSDYVCEMSINTRNVLMCAQCVPNSCHIQLYIHTYSLV